MLDFTWFNPVKIVFGKGTISQLKDLIPSGAKILMTYGGGSIKANKVYDQVMAALSGRDVLEFGGIEPNPRYETCIKAVDICRKKKVAFLLSVGGGSVLDGTKFIALASNFKGKDPWSILTEGSKAESAIPIGCVLTLPATGSESNSYFVVSRESTRQKLAGYSQLVMPQFSILDPSTTFSLPAKQVSNGIVDAFVHVMELYLTYPVNSPLQDRQAEAILQTLSEEGPKTLANPTDYDTRANLVWCATQALNGLIACGVPQDWSTHMIGHEITAEYGIDHACSLAIVLPGMMQFCRNAKKAKILQYGRLVWGIAAGSDEKRLDETISRTEEFIKSVGLKTRLKDYNIPANASDVIAKRLANAKLGEHGNIGPKEVKEILQLRA